jgi:hypothetical protein
MINKILKRKVLKAQRKATTLLIADCTDLRGFLGFGEIKIKWRGLL